MQEKEEVLKRLGEILLSLRKEKGVSGYKVGKDTGIINTIRLKMEKGQINYGVYNLYNYLQVLGIDLGEILEREILSIKDCRINSKKPIFMKENE
jgi:transcriptional regulator with XRE-family HTH domain